MPGRKNEFIYNFDLEKCRSDTFRDYRNNVKIYLREIGYEDENSNDLSEDRI
jgi:hypothetical protein